jgi:ABC-type transport system substrate-binding protein
MKRVTVVRTSLVALILLIAISVAPVGAQDNILRIASNFDIRTADPHIAYELETWPTVALFYRSLVELENADTAVPGLAESWTISEDGLTYTFVLREGIKFSNGRDITPEDVVYSWERWNSPDVPSPTAYFFDALQGVAEFRAGEAETISGITIVDERAVQFQFDFPVWTMIQRFALPPSAIIAREGVEAAENFGFAPLGAGPFKLVSWEPGVRIVGERNEFYHKEGLPNFDGFEMTLFVEPSVGILRMDAGEADVALDFVPNADFPRINADPALAERLVQTVAFPNIDYVVFQTRTEPFNNTEVRRALSMAIDRERLNTILNGRAVPANGPVPPGVPGDNTEVAPFAYEPDAAREMLAAAGYAEGFTTEILTNTDPTNVAISQAIIADWAVIGVTATLVSIDNAQFLDILINQPETIQVVMTNWYLDYQDPSNVYEPLYGCGGSYNWGGYCNEELQAAFDETNLIPFGDDRWAAFAEFEAMLFEQQPVAFLYHLQNYYYRSERVSIETDAALVFKWDEAGLNP